MLSIDLRLLVVTVTKTKFFIILQSVGIVRCRLHADPALKSFSTHVCPKWNRKRFICAGQTSYTVLSITDSKFIGGKKKTFVRDHVAREWNASSDFTSECRSVLHTWFYICWKGKKREASSLKLCMVESYNGCPKYPWHFNRF